MKEFIDTTNQVYYGISPLSKTLQTALELATSLGKQEVIVGAINDLPPYEALNNPGSKKHYDAIIDACQTYTYTNKNQMTR